jgi:hypothetical protein
MRVGPCIPVGIQLAKAEVGPTFGPTWRLSHLHAGGPRRDGAGEIRGAADAAERERAVAEPARTAVLGEVARAADATVMLVIERRQRDVASDRLNVRADT